MQTCSKCNLEKSLDEFYQSRDKNKKSKSKVCKKCWSIYKKAWYQKPDNKVKSLSNWKRYNLKQFGLTTEQYAEMVKKQDNRCAICGSYESVKKNLSVDHNHITNKIRGLLCYHCNLGIGHLKDNTQILENAISYLERNT